MDMVIASVYITNYYAHYNWLKNCYWAMYLLFGPNQAKTHTFTHVRRQIAPYKETCVCVLFVCVRIQLSGSHSLEGRATTNTVGLYWWLQSPTEARPTTTTQRKKSSKLLPVGGRVDSCGPKQITLIESMHERIIHDF